MFSAPTLRLLAVSGLWSFALALSDAFVNAYLWSLGQGLALIGAFNFVLFGAMAVAFVLGGYLAKRWTRQLPLQLGVLLVALFLWLTFVLGPQASRVSLGLAALFGGGLGLYWLSYFILAFDLAPPQQRDWLQGATGALDAASTLVAPTVSAALVANLPHLVGYRWLFASSGGLLLLALSLARFPSEGHPARRERFRPWVAWPSSGRGPWFFILVAHTVLALRDGVYLFAPALLIFVLSKSAWSLGLYLSATAGAATLAYSVAGKLGSPQNRRRLLFWGAIANVVAGGLLILGFTPLTLWLFGLLSALFSPLLKVPVEACTLDVIAFQPAPERFKIEYTVVKEVLINLGRALSAGAVTLALFQWAETDLIRWALVLLSPLALLAYAAMTQFRPFFDR